MIYETIKLWEEDNMWIIKHSDSGVTTQGETRIEALLMLADAINGHYEEKDLLSESERIFEISDDKL